MFLGVGHILFSNLSTGQNINYTSSNFTFFKYDYYSLSDYYVFCFVILDIVMQSYTPLSFLN